jgi:hypothetical protein
VANGLLQPTDPRNELPELYINIVRELQKPSQRPAINCLPLALHRGITKWSSGKG